MYSGSQHVLIMWVTWWVSYKWQELLTLRGHLSSPPGFWWGLYCSYFFAFCIAFLFALRLVYLMLPCSLDCILWIFLFFLAFIDNHMLIFLFILFESRILAAVQRTKKNGLLINQTTLSFLYSLSIHYIKTKS